MTLAPDHASSSPSDPSSSGLRSKLQERDLVAAWAAQLKEELKAPAFQRDPGFIAKLLPLMEIMNRYFDAEVRGLSRIPAKGPVLLVGNHSGGMLTPDTTAVISAWYRERGIDSPLALLALDALFGIPQFKTLCRKLGLVPASEGNADRALASGSSILVYPGGAHEAFRPYAERDRIDFNGRKGFIKLALRSGVPVVPVVGQGGHASTRVLSRGDALADTLGMSRIRLAIFPIMLQIPWGISSAALPGVPLPVKIVVEVCEPLDWSRFGPEAATDPAVLARCYEEITDVMQGTLTRLAAENPRPLTRRLTSLFRRSAR